MERQFHLIGNTLSDMSNNASCSACVAMNNCYYVNETSRQGGYSYWHFSIANLALKYYVPCIGKLTELLNVIRNIIMQKKLLSLIIKGRQENWQRKSVEVELSCCLLRCHTRFYTPTSHRLFIHWWKTEMLAVMMMLKGGEKPRKMENSQKIPQFSFAIFSHFS